MTWIIWGIVLLNLLGFFLDGTWNNKPGECGYFAYNIALLNNLPYWLFATLLFLVINGISALFFAIVRFRLNIEPRVYNGWFPLPPLRLLGINLLSIPALLILFLIFRAIGL